MVTISEDDEGKTVVDADGEVVGIVAAVGHGTAHVDPDPGITDKIMSTLGWSDQDEDTYPLQEEAVEAITDDEVRLRARTSVPINSDALSRIFQAPKALELAADGVRLFQRAEHPLKFISAMSDRDFERARTIVNMSEEEFNSKMREMYMKSRELSHENPELANIDLVTEGRDGQ